MPTEERTRPVRITVDLDPAQHARLKRWCLESAVEIGHPLVKGSDVVRLLLTRLDDDQALAEWIRRRL